MLATPGILTGVCILPGRTIRSSARGKTSITMQNFGTAEILTGFITVVMVFSQVAHGYQDNALVEAGSRNDLKRVQQLLETGADVNSKDKDGATALIEASFKGHAEMVRLLLEKGADVNAPDRVGVTPLMEASFLGHLELVKLLFGTWSRCQCGG